MLTRAIICFLTLNLAVSSSLASAQEPSNDWFQIEYVLFEHLTSDRHVLRYEDTPYQPLAQKQYQYLYNLGEPLSPYQIKPLDSRQEDLRDAYFQLKRSSDIRVHSKGAWQQEIPRESETLPLKLKGGKLVKNGRYQLEGELKVRRSRYMHVDINTYYSTPVALPYDNIQNWLNEAEEVRWPVPWLVVPLAYEHPSLEYVGESLIANNIVHLNQSRRIKDEEVHYIDHPVLSMIVTIKKIDDPNQLEDEFETGDS